MANYWNGEVASYSVSHHATTDNYETYAPDGIHFGNNKGFRPDGRLISDASVKIANHDRREEGYVPRTSYYDAETGKYRSVVSTEEMMLRFKSPQLSSMARSIREVREHYGHRESRMSRAANVIGYVFGRNLEPVSLSVDS